MNLYDQSALANLSQGASDWRNTTRQQAVDRFPERYDDFSTISGVPIGGVYTPTDIAETDYEREHRLPRRVSLHTWYPCYRPSWQVVDHAYVRRIRHGGGDQSAIQYLLGEGQTGLSVALTCRPSTATTQMRLKRKASSVLWCGLRLAGRYGGVARRLAAGSITTSMTINSPAAVIGRCRLLRPRNKGLRARSWAERCRTTSSRSTQPKRSSSFRRPSMRLVTDTIEFGPRNCRAGTRFRSPAITSARPAQRQPRNWLLHWLTDSSMCVGPWTVAWM